MDAGSIPAASTRFAKQAAYGRLFCFLPSHYKSVSLVIIDDQAEI